jgi:hypothetical protein
MLEILIINGEKTKKDKKVQELNKLFFIKIIILLGEKIEKTFKKSNVFRKINRSLNRSHLQIQ